jgi:hypothetical protein
MRTTRSELDPVRIVRPPRRRTTWRAAVATVLTLAAAVAWSGAGGSDRAPTAASPTLPASLPASPAAAPTIPVEGDRLPVPAGLVGVPVPLASPTATAILRPGDRVDLLATGVDDPRPVVLAEDAPVLAVDHPGGAVLLGLPPPAAHEVIAATTTASFAVTIRS